MIIASDRFPLSVVGWFACGSSNSVILKVQADGLAGCLHVVEDLRWCVQSCLFEFCEGKVLLVSLFGLCLGDLMAKNVMRTPSSIFDKT